MELIEPNALPRSNMTENFNSDFKNLSKPENLPMLKLSGRCFDNGFDITVKEGYLRRRMQKIYTFDIDLDINPDFLYCDLKDEIELFQKEDNKIIFRGVIKDALIEGKNAKLIAEDFGAKLNYVSINGLETSPYMDPGEIISILLMPFFYGGIRLGNVPGVPDTSIRNFIAIVPIKNLIFKEEFKIGNVEFYNNFNKIDDKIIRKMDLGKNVHDWNSNPTRARVIIKSSEFKTALFNGYSRISTAIDFITLRNELSFPRLTINNENEYLNFHYNELAANVAIPTWVYCREDDTDIYAIYNIEISKDNALNLESNSLKYFEVIDQLFTKFLCKDPMTQNEKNLLMTIHWLRRAIQSGDNRDKLLDLWTAMEFLISGTKVMPLFCREQKDSIKRLLCSNLELTDVQKEVLYKKIDMLNDPSLMVMIDTLIQELEINLTDEESDLLVSARKKRNSVIHGKKDVVVCDKELNKLRSIIERLLIGKMNFKRKILI